MILIAEFFHKLKSCLMGRIFLPALVLLPLMVYSSTAHADFTISPSEWKIGEVDEGDKLALEVTITNNSAKSQVLNRIFHSCDCLDVKYSPATLEVGQSTLVKLSLTIINLPKKFEFLLFIEGDEVRVQTFSISGSIQLGGKERVYPPIPKNSSGKALVIHFFFSLSCSNCDEIIAGPVKEVLDRYKDLVGFVSYNMSDPKDGLFNYRLMKTYEKKFGVEKNAPVEVFIGSRVLVGKKEVAEKLHETVRLELIASGNDITDGIIDTDLFENISISGAIIYGFIDGLNPCVFAGLILFLSYLLASGLKGRKLLQVGVTYCIAVFITYFAIGLAVFSFFYSTSAYPTIKRVLIWFAIVIASGGAIASFRDAFVAHRGQVSRVWLQLPKKLKDFSSKLIRSKKGRFTVLASTFALGVILTVIEGACTGIQYIPACAMMVTAGESLNQRFFGILLLALYNLAFILPLLALLFFVLSGRKFTSFKKMQTKNVVLARVASGILLIAVVISIICFS